MTRNPYETKQYLNDYLFFHYGDPKEFCPYPFAPKEALRFQERILPECLLPLRFKEPTRGLDVGCAVGRLTCELARVVDSSIGIDNSRSFIRAARHMARGGSMQIEVKEEGERSSPRTVSLPRALRNCNVTFQVGDAQDLPQFKGDAFHVLTAINLIDRLPDPRKFLRQVPDLILPGGQLILGSPYTWMEEYTPRRNWLCSARRSTAQTLDSILRSHFRLVRRRDLPFLIREHSRKYQWCVSQVSVYVRKS